MTHQIEMNENIFINTYFNRNIINSIDSNTIITINNSINIKKNDTLGLFIDNIETDFNLKINELKEETKIEDISNTYKFHKSLEVIQKELEVIKLISKYSLQNNMLDYVFIISCLKYLYKLSEILRVRLNQSVININKQNKNGIIRCSYKFCNFKDGCVYNYSRKGNCCYQDHYVHNMISHDLSALILYIGEVDTNLDTINHNKEILKSINTLSFVIGHMETELRTKCMYAERKDWDSFHYIHIANKPNNYIAKK
jgi:hypothetical protein